MRLLIAGWQGQLARALVAQAMRSKQVEACAVGRPALDICNLPTIERAIGEVDPDVVINTAAYTAVDTAESEPDAAFALNAEGAGQIARAAERRGVPVIHISTDYVFDGAKPTPYLEVDPTGPINVYGRSKLAGELAVAAANPRHVIVRTSWVYSATGKNFVRTMLRLAADRPHVDVVDDQVGCPTFAPHLATAILEIAGRIAKADDTQWGVYHAAGAGAISWHGLAQALFAECRGRGQCIPDLRAISSAQFPTAARRPANSRLDCGKLERQLGVTQPPWQEGLRACLDELGVGQP